MLNNKYLIIIFSIVLVISIGVTVALVVINKDGTPDPPDVTEDPIISDTPIIPDKPSQIPVFLGNADLSDERTALLDSGILAEIERLKTGVPKEDEEGNFLTDEHGILIFESSYVVDYPDMETNLAVIINHFADKGYTEEAIIQIQRYYFHFARSFAKYSTEELFDKGLSLGEVDKHKNRPQDYEVLFHIDWENKIYRFAYDDFGDYYELKGGVHPPLPAHDLYIEAIVGAIYKDRGYDYTRQWVIRFFERNGLKIGETPIYVNKTQRQNTQ